MTIQEFNDKLVTAGSNSENNKYFGNSYSFILHTIDHKYADMVDTYLLYVLNVTKRTILTMENIHKFRIELKTYSDNDIIEITYDDTIIKADGTEIYLKNDQIYNQIKELMRGEIDKVIESKRDTMKDKIKSIMKSTHRTILPLGAKSETFDPGAKSETFDTRQIGGKRKLRRKSRKRKTHHRKTRRH